VKKIEPLNKFFDKIDHNCPGVYATNLTATLETMANITCSENLVELPHFALQHRSSYSYISVKSFLHATGTSIQQTNYEIPCSLKARF